MPNQTFFNAYESNVFEHYTQSPKTTKIDCMASYNTEDTAVPPKYICPQTNPNCVGYQGGTVYGKCQPPKPTLSPTESVQDIIDSVEQRVNVPTGTIIMFASETPPFGYLKCNGQRIKKNHLFKYWNQW